MCSWQTCNSLASSAVPFSKILIAKTTDVVQPVNLTSVKSIQPLTHSPMYTHIYHTPHHGDTSVELAQDT